jgi:hypothetical protein
MDVWCAFEVPVYITCHRKQKHSLCQRYLLFWKFAEVSNYRNRVCLCICALLTTVYEAVLVVPLCMEKDNTWKSSWSYAVGFSTWWSDSLFRAQLTVSLFCLCELNI